VSPTKNGRTITSEHRHFTCAVHLKTAEEALARAYHALADELEVAAAANLRMALIEMAHAFDCLLKGVRK
jgi:hypothetical protein